MSTITPKYIILGLAYATFQNHCTLMRMFHNSLIGCGTVYWCHGLSLFRNDQHRYKSRKFDERAKGVVNLLHVSWWTVETEVWTKASLSVGILTYSLSRGLPDLTVQSTDFTSYSAASKVLIRYSSLTHRIGAQARHIRRRCFLQIPILTLELG